MTSWHQPLVQTCAWLRQQKLRAERLAHVSEDPVITATAQQRAQACGVTVARIERVLVDHGVPLPGPPGRLARWRAGLVAQLARVHVAVLRGLVARTAGDDTVAARIAATLRLLDDIGAPEDARAALRAVDVPVIAPWSAAEGAPTCH